MKKDTSNNNFYARVRELAKYGTKDHVNENKSIINTTLIDYVRSNSGTAYGIVKENHDYFIKVSTSQDNILNESDFAFINGLENKNLYKYTTLHDAQKRRNMFKSTIDESFSLETKKESSDTKPETTVTSNNVITNRILEGRKQVMTSTNEAFKKRLEKNIQESFKAKDDDRVLNETAKNSIQKALGLVSESEEIITADSERKDSDDVNTKKGKEESQSPVNDKNAKSEADKAQAKDSIPTEAKVNEAEDLSTADSEITISDSLVNKENEKHETAQAPVNDENAKSEAEKANATDSMPAELKQPESLSVNSAKTKDDVVSEDVDKGTPFDKKATDSGSDIITADSDHTDGDRVDNETKSETADSDYSDKTQPEKGYKEESGEALKKEPSKVDVVAEAEDLTTKDSEIVDGDIMPNKKDKKESADAPVNDSNAKKNAEKANATDSMPAELKQPKSLSVNEGLEDEDEASMDGDGGDEIEAAIDSLDDLDASEPEVEAGEENGDLDDIDINTVDASEPEVEAGEENGDNSLEKQELDKYIGKAAEIARNMNMPAEDVKAMINSITASVEDELAQMETIDKEEIADKITDANGAPETGEVEESTDDSGLSDEEETNIDAQIDALGGGEVSDEGGFDSFIQDKGYEGMGGASSMEAANLISSFANDYNEGENDGDFERVAIYVTPEVAAELAEYGHADYVDQLPKVEEGSLFDYGAVQSNDLTGEPLGEDDDDEVSNSDMPEHHEEAPSAMAPAGTIMGVGTPPKSKSINIDLANDTVNMTVTESKEDQLRRYVRKKLQERVEGKNSLNESQTSQLIDKLIDQHLKNFSK